MGQPAPIPRRSRHLGSAACSGRSDHGSHASTSAASSRSNRRQGNHNQFQTLKMFPDGHSDYCISRAARALIWRKAHACWRPYVPLTSPRLDEVHVMAVSTFLFILVGTAVAVGLTLLTHRLRSALRC